MGQLNQEKNKESEKRNKAGQLIHRNYLNSLQKVERIESETQTDKQKHRQGKPRRDMETKNNNSKVKTKDYYRNHFTNTMSQTAGRGQIRNNNKLFNLKLKAGQH